MKKWIIAVSLLSGIAMISAMAMAEKEVNLYREGFSLSLEKGKEMKLSEMAGNPSIVFFYNSRCGCKSYRGLIDRTYLSYRDSGLKVVGVGVRDNADKFFRFAREEGFSFTSAFDATKELEKNCSIYRVPVTLFINREGTIVKKTKGYMKEEELKDEIKKLISQADKS